MILLGNRVHHQFYGGIKYLRNKHQGDGYAQSSQFNPFKIDQQPYDKDRNTDEKNKTHITMVKEQIKNAAKRAFKAVYKTACS